MNESQIANLRYQLEILENIDTDIMIYDGDSEQMEYLHVDRQLAGIKVKYTMEQILKNWK